MGKIEDFRREVEANIEHQARDPEFQRASALWLEQAARARYSHNFTWLGRPIIQLPQDMLALQEVIWRVKPDLIVETGIAHGGSLIFYASLLELIGGDGVVLGIDTDIRAHNREEIERHRMFKRIRMLQGSSTDPAVVEHVRQHARGRRSVLVALDSNHTHAHVLQELQFYAPLVTRDSYIVVFDTAVEDLSDGLFPNRPWGRGNNPKTAVREFLRTTDRFVIDAEIEAKLMVTVAPDGYLRCVKE